MENRKEKFTRGPWRAVIGEAERPNKVYRNRALIATLPAHLGCAYVEDLANLALIAAAPEMYGMLQELHSYFCQDPEIWARIHDLLAKARGEEVDDGE